MPLDRRNVDLVNDQSIDGAKTFTGDLKVTSDTVSSSTITGAVVVTGGVGVGEDLYVADIRLGGSGTIAQSTWANGTFHLGNATAGWAMDPNELYNSGTALIGTLAGDLTLNPVAGSLLSERPVSFSNSSITFSGITADNGESTAVVINGSNVLKTRELGSNAFTSTTYAPLASPTFTGTVTAPNLTLSSLSASVTEATSLFINGSNQVVTRELGSNAFNSTSYLPLTGGTLSGTLTVSDSASVTGDFGVGGTVNVGTSPRRTTYSSLADELILDNGGNAGSTGLTIVSDRDFFGSITFANQDSDDSFSLIYAHLSDTLRYSNANNETVFAMSSSGNFGIGEDNPVANIHINAFNPNIRLVDNDVNTAGTIEAADGLLILNADKGSVLADSKIVFRVDNSDAVTINDALNLGVGVADADFRLQVANDIDPATTTPSNSTSSLVELENLNTSADTFTTLTFSAADNTGVVRHGASISMYKDGTWTADNDYSGGLTFYTRSGTNSQAEAMKITPSGNVEIISTVEIVGGSQDLLFVGTAGTASEFAIGGWNNTTDADIDALIGGSTFGTIMRGAPSGHVVLALRENDVGDGFHIVSGGGNWQTDSTYDTVVASFMSTGNVGIGQDNPSALLSLQDGSYAANADVGIEIVVGDDGDANYWKGGFKIGSDASGVGEMRLECPADATGGVFVPYKVNNTGNGEHYWYDESSTELMKIDTAGDLSVVGSIILSGTSRSVPGAGVEFVGGTSSALLGVQDGNGRIQLKWNATNGTSETYLVSSEPAFFWDMTITTTPIWEMKYAAAGTAGNAITWTVLLSLSSSGDLIASGNVTANSDERLKSNIRTIPNALNKVSSMRGVHFEKDGKEGSGIIAQELQEVAPELVVEEGEYLSVAYGNLVGYLIEAIKEQNQLISNQQSQIDELREMIMEMKNDASH